MTRLLLMLLTALLYEVPQALAVPTMDSECHDIAVTDQMAIDTLIWIGEVYKQPLGIVASDSSITSTHVTLELSNATFEDALVRVMKRLPKYQFRDVEGVILIQPRSLDAATERLFTMLLPSFDSDQRATVAQLSDLLWMDVETQNDPTIRGFAGIRHSKDRAELEPIHLSHVTVTEVLNALIRKRKAAAWVGFAAPETLNGVPRERLWSVVTYEDPPSPVENLCCLDRGSLVPTDHY